MATEAEIVKKYDEMFRQLHDEFYETINLVRKLRSDKQAEDFNTRYAEIQRNYDDELAREGIVRPIPAPPRDLAAEIDEIKARIEKLENRSKN